MKIPHGITKFSNYLQWGTLGVEKKFYVPLRFSHQFSGDKSWRKEAWCQAFPHIVFQKWLKNLESLSKTILLGNSTRRTTYLKKIFSTWHTSSTLWHGMKCVILKNLSTTTKIKSLPLLDLGRLSTKSMDMLVHGKVEMSNKVYNPWFMTLDLALWHIMQFGTMF